MLRRSLVLTAALAAVLPLGAAAPSAHAVLVVDWNLSDNLGSPAPIPTSEPVNASGANIVGMAITRGAGLTTSQLAGAFSSAGWEGAAVGALSNEYLSFGFTVDAGYSVDLTSLNLGTRSSNTGPGTVGLYYSGDSFATPLATLTQTGGTFVNFSIPLTTLTGLTGAVEFRLIEIGNVDAVPPGATAAGGTFGVSDYFVAAVESSNMGFQGTINPVAVPEPSAFLYGGLIATSLCGWKWRQKRRTDEAKI